MIDPTEFTTFVRDYQGMVFTTALRLVGSEADAEDIAQEVFLKAYERFADLSQSPTAGGWLKTVARNLALNHLTRYRARWRFFSEFLSGDEADEAPYEVPAPESTTVLANEGDQRLLLERALQKLPSAQRIPLVLYHFEDLGYDEIAARLGISLAKVKTDIFRGRAALRRHLQMPSTSGGDDWAEYGKSRRANGAPAKSRPGVEPFEIKAAWA